MTMVDKTNNEVRRRKILQVCGTGLAAFTGNATTGAVAATDTVSNSDFVFNKIEQDEPVFTEDGKIGFSKGTLQTPITQTTIGELYSRVIGENLESGRVALPRPAMDETERDSMDETTDKVIGVMVSVNDGTPYISTNVLPEKSGPSVESYGRDIEDHIHKNLERKIKKFENKRESRYMLGEHGGNDTVRYDENYHVHTYKLGEDCSASMKVGEFRVYTKLKRHDYMDEYENEERSEWAMSQKGHMWPLCTNHNEFDYDEGQFGDQYECWLNYWCDLNQDWNASELDDLGIIEYNPSYTDETETSLNTSISASTPRSAGISVSLDFPELEIQSELTDHKLEANHDFWSDMLKIAYDAATEDVQLGTVTSFDSRKPDTNDKIVSGYMSGSFTGWGLECANLDRCNVHNDRTIEEGSISYSFYEENIDDL